MDLQRLLEQLWQPSFQWEFRQVKIHHIILKHHFDHNKQVTTRVELLPAFKFTGKMVKIKEFTGKW